MKKLIYISVILAIFLSSQAFADDWDETDELLFSTFLLFQITDLLQTKYIFDHPDEHIETNEYINKGVEGIGTIFIPIYFVGLTSSCYFIADFLDSPWRTGALILFNLGAFNTIGGNFSRGAGLSFSLTF